MFKITFTTDILVLVSSGMIQPSCSGYVSLVLCGSLDSSGFKSD